MTARTLALATALLCSLGASAALAANGAAIPKDAAKAAADPANAAKATDPRDLCKGRLETIRISKIKEGGTLAGFLEAVADHNAWYRSHGVDSNLQVVAREIKRDPKTNSFSIAEDEVVTIHINPPPRDENKRDAAWDAFVKKYRDNSDVVTARMICVPDTPK